MEQKKYKLEKISTIVNGSTPSTTHPEYYDGEIVWVTPKDLSDQKSKYIEKGSRNITEEGFNSCSTQMIPANSILLTSRAPIGLLAINTVECCTNQGFKNIVIDPEKVDVDYLYYYLKHHLKEIEALGVGTTFKEVSKTSLEQFTVSLPNLAAQKKVAGVLSNLDRKIALNQQINRNLEALAKQIYDYWFVQFDFPDENGKPYKISGGKMVWNEELKREIPVGWRLETIGNVLGKINNTPRLMTEEYNKYGTYPIIDQSSDNYYAGFTERQEALLNQYPVVVFGDHSCSVKYVNFPFCRGADGTQIMYPKDESVSAEYLYFAVKGVKISQGYARHYSFLKGSLIILPQIQVANMFHEFASGLFTMIRENRLQVLELQKQRDAMLPLLMNGQINSDLSAC